MIILCEDFHWLSVLVCFARWCIGWCWGLVSTWPIRYIRTEEESRQTIEFIKELESTKSFQVNSAIVEQDHLQIAYQGRHGYVPNVLHGHRNVKSYIFYMSWKIGHL